MKVNKFLLPVLAVVALLGSVWIAKAAGAWQTSGRDQILVDESGQPDPAGIKGWMTLTDVSETYGLPLEAVYTLVGAGPEIPPDTALKDLEKLVPGMEVWAVREGVAAYLDGTWSPADGRYGGKVEPASETQAGEATPIPTPTPTPTPVPTAIPAGEHVPQGQGSGDGTGREVVLPADGSPLPGAQIKGWMTLADVEELYQVPLDYLLAELGLAPDVDPATPMRDLASQLGVEVLTVREVVERYQTGP
jgi:hypothetical protein